MFTATTVVWGRPSIEGDHQDDGLDPERDVMIVFVIETGQNQEGGRAIGVYATYQSAKAAALRYPYVFERWVPSDGDPAVATSGIVSCWQSGPDYIRVTEFEVNET